MIQHSLGTSDCFTAPRGPIQYRMRRLIVRLRGMRSVRVFQLLWNLAGVSAALLWRRLPNFKDVHFNTWASAFETLRDLTMRHHIRYHILNRPPGYLVGDSENFPLKFLIERSRTAFPGSSKAKGNNELHGIMLSGSLIRSRPKLKYGAGRDFGVGPEFGATRKQPIIPGNSRARSFACEEDRVTWLDLQPG